MPAGAKRDSPQGSDLPIRGHQLLRFRPIAINIVACIACGACGTAPHVPDNVAAQVPFVCSPELPPRLVLLQHIPSQLRARADRV